MNDLRPSLPAFVSVSLRGGLTGLCFWRSFCRGRCSRRLVSTAEVSPSLWVSSLTCLGLLIFPLILKKVKERISGLWFLISIPSEFLGHKLREHGPVPGGSQPGGGDEHGTVWPRVACAHVSRNQASPMRGVTEVYSQIKAKKLSSYCSCISVPGPRSVSLPSENPSGQPSPSLALVGGPPRPFWTSCPLRS